MYRACSETGKNGTKNPEADCRRRIINSSSNKVFIMTSRKNIVNVTRNHKLFKRD